MWSIVANGIKQLMLRIAELCTKTTDGDKPDISNSFLCQLVPNKEDEQLDRGYYHGPAYPPFGFGLDPLLFLAGLAFLALLMQTFHSFFYRTHIHSGVPAASLPRTLANNHLVHLVEFVSVALQKYEKLSLKKEIRENKVIDAPSILSAILPTIENFLTKSRAQSAS